MLSKARQLGLGHDCALDALESLHSTKVASGSVRVGRTIITQPVPPAHRSVECAAFGYIYAHSTHFASGDVTIRNTRHSRQSSVAPRLVFRFVGDFTEAVSLKEFSAMFDGIALGLEVIALPFKNQDFVFEDVICGNGFSYENIVGEMKILSQSSRLNFSAVLQSSAVSISSINGSGSTIRGVSYGAGLCSSSLEELYGLSMNYLRIHGKPPLEEGDLVCMPHLCAPAAIAVGDEWVCVSAGLNLGELRVRFKK